MRSLRMEVLEVPEVVVSSLGLRNLGVRLRLCSVHYRTCQRGHGAPEAEYNEPRSGNFIASWTKKTGMSLPTISQFPSSV